MAKLLSLARLLTSLVASLARVARSILLRHWVTNRVPYMSRRSAGPWISKLRKRVFARKSERTSSSAS